MRVLEGFEGVLEASWGCLVMLEEFWGVLRRLGASLRRLGARLEPSLEVS